MHYTWENDKENKKQKNKCLIILINRVNHEMLVSCVFPILKYKIRFVHFNTMFGRHFKFINVFNEFEINPTLRHKHLRAGKISRGKKNYESFRHIPMKKDVLLSTKKCHLLLAGDIRAQSNHVVKHSHSFDRKCQRK